MRIISEVEQEDRKQSARMVDKLDVICIWEPGKMETQLTWERKEAGYRVSLRACGKSELKIPSGLVRRLFSFL